MINMGINLGDVQMVKILQLLLLFLLSVSSCFAGIGQLSREFVGVNSEIIKNRYQLEKIGLNTDLISATKSWYLKGSYVHDDNRLKNISGLAPSNTITKTSSIGLSRAFSWGGGFSIENNLLSYDLSKWSSLARGTNSSNMYEFQNVVSYTQDLGVNFFGRSYRSELNLAYLNTEVTDFELKKINQSLLYQFYVTYISARLNRTMTLLQTEALERSRRRDTLIAKKVKDGLNELVDLYQAQIDFNGQKEALKSYQKDLKGSLVEISNKIHRAVRVEEIPVYDFSSLVFDQPAKVIDIENNFDLITLKKRGDYYHEQVRKSKFDYFPTITMAAKYKSNALENSASSSQSEAFPTGDNNEKTISISISIPIGNEMAKTKVAQATIEKMSNEMDYSKRSKDIYLEVQQIDEQILLLMTNMELSHKKRLLAQKALKEMNRLFNLGRADLDRVIRAEETLINTEKSYAGSIMSYESLRAKRYVMEGKLYKFLENLSE